MADSDSTQRLRWVYVPPWWIFASTRYSCRSDCTSARFVRSLLFCLLCRPLPVILWLSISSNIFKRWSEDAVLNRRGSSLAGMWGIVVVLRFYHRVKGYACGIWCRWSLRFDGKWLCIVAVAQQVVQVLSCVQSVSRYWRDRSRWISPHACKFAFFHVRCVFVVRIFWSVCARLTVYLCCIVVFLRFSQSWFKMSLIFVHSFDEEVLCWSSFRSQCVMMLCHSETVRGTRFFVSRPDLPHCRPHHKQITRAHRVGLRWSKTVGISTHTFCAVRNLGVIHRRCTWLQWCSRFGSRRCLCIIARWCLERAMACRVHRWGSSVQVDFFMSFPYVCCTLVVKIFVGLTSCLLRRK